MNKDIQIKRLSSDTLPRIKYIWEKCFGDSEDFLNVYFSDIIPPSGGFGLYETDKLVSDLFMLPFNAKFDDILTDAYFLAGCATLPEARNKDYMKALIKHALEYFYNKGRCVTYLHPFKHDFYRKFGYETIAYVDNYSLKRENKSADYNCLISEKYNEIPLQKLLQAYNREMKKFDNCFIRDENRFRSWIKLLFADGGKAAYSYNQNSEIANYALFYETDEKSCDIFELIAPDYINVKEFVNELPYENINYFLTSANNYKTTDNSEFTMMRVVNPQHALKVYRFKNNEEFTIKIVDNFLEKNYNLSVKPNNPTNRVDFTDASADFESDINRFAQLITGSYSPEISNCEKEFFYRQSSCFFETY